MCVQTDAALARDALTLVSASLRYLKNSTRHVFKTFRQGQLYNNGTRGVQCWKTPLKPWVHGPTIREAIYKVFVNFLFISCIADVKSPLDDRKQMSMTAKRVSI